MARHNCISPAAGSGQTSQNAARIESLRKAAMDLERGITRLELLGFYGEGLNHTRSLIARVLDAAIGLEVPGL